VSRGPDRSSGQPGAAVAELLLVAVEQKCKPGNGIDAVVEAVGLRRQVCPFVATPCRRADKEGVSGLSRVVSARALRG